MKLSIESINIKKITCDGGKTQAKKGVLNVNIQELQKKICEDSRIASVDIELLAPGDKVRILNVQDVVQPRCKIDSDADFPGFVSKMQTAGSGRTRSLLGLVVAVSNPDTGRVESGILDMAGPAAEMSHYGKMNVVSIVPRKAAGVEERDFENAVKKAGFKTAVYLAQGAEGHQADDEEIFDIDIPGIKTNGLPRVACFYQAYSPQFNYQAIGDAIVYGTEIGTMLPSIFHPNEVLDGGFVGWNALKALDTYSLQNHGVVRELYRQHGKTLNFVGVVAATANMTADARERSACMSAKLIKHVLGADGAILVKILGGMPHLDISSTGAECERLGVKTAVTTTPLTATGTLSDTILFNEAALDLIITSGAPFERSKVEFKAEKFLGGTPETVIYHPNKVLQHAGDPVLDIEQYLIAGFHDHTGGRNVVVKEY